MTKIKEYIKYKTYYRWDGIRKKYLSFNRGHDILNFKILTKEGLDIFLKIFIQLTGTKSIYFILSLT